MMRILEKNFFFLKKKEAKKTFGTLGLRLLAAPNPGPNVQKSFWFFFFRKRTFFLVCPK